MSSAKIVACLGVITGDTARPFINAFKQAWAWPMRFGQLRDGA